MSLKILLQQKSGFKLNEEDLLVERWAAQNNYVTEMAHLSALERRRVDVGKYELVVGDLSFMSGALRSMGLSLPPDNSYPEVLSGYLGRSAKRTKLQSALLASERYSVFVKPSEKTKRFTGKVIFGGEDYFLNSVSKNEPVWMCEVVTWRSEYRFYVNASRIVHSALYAGNPDVVVDERIIDEAVALLAKEGFDTYAIDFGVDDFGRTLLVEFNEGFSIGAYGEMDATSYSELLLRRWTQLKITP